MTRTGVRVGVDVGSVRVGLASSDPSGLLATPVRTVARGQSDAVVPGSEIDVATCTSPAPGPG